MSEPSSRVAALLLTGGTSARMGRDKSQLMIEGSPLSRRIALLLSRVVDTVLEVGPGVSGLPTTREEPPGGGPLSAIDAGWRVLRAHDFVGSLVIACDLPFLSEDLLRYLVEWETPGSVVPIVEGRAQPLCARWGRDDLAAVRQLLDRGVRSLKHLVTQPGVTLLDETHWHYVANASAFADVDSPEDLCRWGLSNERAPFG